MRRRTRETAAGAIYHDLRNLARKQGRATDQIFQFYLLERFLYRLSRSPHRDGLVLKGGALLAAYALRRQTRDIDLQAARLDNNEEAIALLVREIAETPTEEEDGIQFHLDTLSTSLIREGDRYEGIRVHLNASLARARLILKLDVSFGDPIRPRPTEITYPSLRQQPFALVGYPLPTVVAEKVSSMIELGDANTRERDFGDVYRIASLHPMDARELRNALRATARYRGIQTRPLADLLTDLPVRRQGPWERWRTRTGLAELPSSFEQVVEGVIAFVDPVLSRSVTHGAWDPLEQRWLS
jgi:predicted nucleotidyltransferase component of viral defense system